MLVYFPEDFNHPEKSRKEDRVQIVEVVNNL